MVANQLENAEAFRQALADYRLSDETREILKGIQLVLLVGPSSSGRNTIINKLVETGRYHYVVSDTTRQPRVNNGILEQNGREYWFRSEEDILADLKAGRFLEAAIIHDQQVSGISMRELQLAAGEHKIAIDEIEVVGADHIHELCPGAQFLFILPPSFDEWMARMAARGVLPPDETRRRLESAIFEITTALDRDFYTFVVNDTFARSARYVDELIRGVTKEALGQESMRALARELVDDTRRYLLEMA